MKISTFVSLLLGVGVVFFIFAQMATESNTAYNTNINTSKWDQKYNYANRVNNTISPIQTAFSNIEDDNVGWFSKLSSGIVAIPRAVIALPVLLFSSFSIGGEMITGFMNEIGAPVYLLTVGLIMLIIWGIFKLLEVYQRWQI